MEHSFEGCLNHIPINASIEISLQKSYINYEFLLLVVLFILLAASPFLGIDSRYFFIIILAIIAFGGIGKAFGFADTLCSRK